MKNLLKKYVSGFITVVMCMSLLIPATAWADNEPANVLPEGCTLVAAFNNYEYKNINQTLGNSTGTNSQLSPSPVAYGSGKSSLCWKLQLNSEFLYTLDTPLTISSSDKIKIRMRSSEGTQKFNIKLNGTRSNTVPAVTEDWDEYTYTGLTSLSSVGFQCGGWSQSAYTTGAWIYIDSIWVESASAEYPKAAYPLNGSGDAVAEIVAFNKDATKMTLLGSGWTQKSETTNAREGGNGMYKYFTIPALIQRNENTIPLPSPAIDIKNGGYKYLNMWVYSPRPQNTGVKIYFGNSSSKDTTGLTFDWSGWKLVSFTLGSGAKNATALNLFKLCSNEKPGSANSLTTRGDAHTKFDVGAGSFLAIAQQYNAACTSKTYFGIESAWLSKNKPVGANEVIPPVSTQIQEAPESERIIADYNAPDAVLPTNAAAFVANSYKGGKSARSRLFGATYLALDSTTNLYTPTMVSSGISCTQSAEFMIFNNSAEPLTGISGDDYLNFWMYNPSVKYDPAAGYCEYILVVNHDASGSYVNKTIGIPANFEGWKCFSIPMTKINSGWNEDKSIKQIKITTNAWLPAASTDLTAMSHEYTAAELETGYRAGSTYNIWPDRYNYFDFEKMWISSTLPETSFTNANFALKFNGANIEINNKDIRIGTGDTGRLLSGIKGEGIILKRIDTNKFEAVDTVTLCDSKNVTVKPTGLLDVSSAYFVVYPETIDSFGNKYRDRLIFDMSTKDHYLGGIVVDNENSASASVDYRGDIATIVPERAKSCLTGALFGADGKLKSAQVSRYSESNESMTVNLEGAQPGDTARYFLFDGNTFTPFQPQIEKRIGEK